MKSFIKKLLRESLLENTNGFIKNDIDIPDYKDLMLGKYDSLPSKYSNYKAEVKYMTSEEYLREVAKMQNTSYEEQLKIIHTPNVKKIMNDMLNNTSYHMGYINYIDNTQEGRHRMVAADKLGSDKSPVLIITNKENDNNSLDLNKIYNLTNTKDYMSFIDLFDEDITSIIDTYLYDEMKDNKYLTSSNDNSYYLDNFNFQTLPIELTNIVKDELSKIDISDKIEMYDEDEVDFEDEFFIYSLLKSVQPELRDVFKYVNRLMYGVSEYINDKRNFNKLDDVYGDLNLDFLGKNVELKTDLTKEELKNYDFDFYYIYNIKEFKKELSLKWIKKYPFK